MTWNGKLGFQKQPSTLINITTPDLIYKSTFQQEVGAGLSGLDGPQGIMGIQHYERGLMFVETFQCGHVSCLLFGLKQIWTSVAVANDRQMQPQFQPRVSYRHLEWVLGRIDTI